MKIKKHIPSMNLKTSLPPPVSKLLELLCVEFDDKDLDAKIDSSSLNLDSDSSSESSSSDSDEDIDQVMIMKKKKKPSKREANFEKTVPAALIVEPVGISPVNKLTKQMEDLRLVHAGFLRSVNVTLKANQSSQQILREVRCFFCDQTDHCLGLHNCPEVKVCINKGLAAYTPQGRLAHPNGSELPCAYGSKGGMAKVL